MSLLELPVMSACLCFPGDGLFSTLANAGLASLAVWFAFKIVTASDPPPPDDGAPSV